MYTVEFFVVYKTFLEFLENKDFDFDSCLNRIEKQEDTDLVKFVFIANDENIINHLKELHKHYDVSFVPKTPEEKIEELQGENVYLGQLITDLELTLLEFQDNFSRTQLETTKTTQDLGTQITDLDLGLLEHKIVDHTS